jgi:hypothetical protein
MKHTIVIPYSPCFGKFKDGTELRFCLRGLHKHLKGDFEIAIVGPKIPDWVQGVTHIKQTEGKLKTALRMAAEAYPNGFSWWYDDCVLIKDQTIEQVKLTPAKEARRPPQTVWTRNLLAVRDRLVDEGFSDRDYSTPHGPYFFNKSMIDESFEDWPNMAGKFPFETWILNKRNAPWQSSDAVAQYYGAFNNPPSDSRIFVNWCDNGMTPEFMGWMQNRFPSSSRYEKVILTSDIPNNTTGATGLRTTHNQSIPINVDEITMNKPQNTRILFTAHEGCDPRVWAWCGHGIRVFAKGYGALLVELPKCKELNPQWVLFDAIKASLEYPETNEFAWVDGDLVIAYPATNIWEAYPNKLHLCVNGGDFQNNARKRMGIPTSIPNNCTGVVKWNYAEARKISDWYDKNKHRFVKGDGDQEIMGVALHELKMPNLWFHPRMHVSGPNPPARTAFKHKGGKPKIKCIPRFLNTNKRLGISPPDDFDLGEVIKPAVALFSEIYNKHIWVGESRSGVGSGLENTKNIRNELPTLLANLDIRSLIDCPCGDWNWMKHVDLSGINYIGVDIVHDLIEKNKQLYQKEGVSFMVADITCDMLPAADMIMIRDCLVHLPDSDIFRALELLKASGIKWLAATTFPEATNVDIPLGNWMPMNLATEPYNLGNPLYAIKEVEHGKYLGVWKLND